MEELRVIEYLNILKTLEADLTASLDPLKDYDAWEKGFEKSLKIEVLRDDLTNTLQAILDFVNKDDVTAEGKYKMIIK